MLDFIEESLTKEQLAPICRITKNADDLSQVKNGMGKKLIFK
jgi:hypothetical protein